MTTLDRLTEPLVRLFLRIDAAYPSDPVLRAASEFWHLKRAGKIAPSASEIGGCPVEILPYIFRVQLMSNGTKHWAVCRAGHVAGSVLQLTGGDPPEVGNKRVAVRLRRLFDIVAEKSEPYSAMFEIGEQAGRRELVEVFAAPVSDKEKNTHMIFAALNSRIEATR